MIHIIVAQVFALVLCLWGHTAHAEPQTLLTMHGKSHYADDFTRLDYADPAATKGGTLRQAAVGTFDSLNPFAIKGRPAQGLSYVHDRLMARIWDEAFTLAPLIAQKVDVPEDRSAITFFLDPRARFQDGSPITADDVIFSFETLRDHGRPNMRRVYKLVKSADRVDAHTVHFTLDDGYDRETVMILAIMPVLSKAWWSGRTFDSASLDTPVASGPYTISKVEPGRSITYQRVADYWAADLPVNRGHYNFERIVFDYYRDDTVAFEAFKAGQLDVRREWDANKWAKGYDIPGIQSGALVKESLEHHRPERVNSLIFNTRRPPFDDIRVREALGLTLDFRWINENLFYGLYKQVDSYFPNSELAATDTPDQAQIDILTPYLDRLPSDILGPVKKPVGSGSPELMRENLRRADQLLKDAGWVVRDGQRVNAKTGKPFTFEIVLASPDDEKLGLAFTRGLKRLGINANIRVLDQAAFVGRLNDYNYDMVLYFWLLTLSPGTEQVLYWGCEAAKQPARWNYAGICDPVVDDLAQSIPNARDRDDLVSRIRALDRVLMAGQYMIPLYYPGVDFVARSKTIKRPETTPLYGMVMESWWLAP